VEDAHARQLLDEERVRLEGIRGGIARDGLIPETDEQTIQEAAAGQHPADVGTETEYRSQDLGMLEQVERDLAEVADALRRLDDGSYGRCEVCGQPIPDERLEAEPTARFDVEHQRRVDAGGHL
jgi:RNA polymerase-binding transcription factor DksA